MCHPQDKTNINVYKCLNRNNFMQFIISNGKFLDDKTICSLVLCAQNKCIVEVVERWKWNEFEEERRTFYFMYSFVVTNNLWILKVKYPQSD